MKVRKSHSGLFTIELGMKLKITQAWQVENFNWQKDMYKIVWYRQNITWRLISHRFWSQTYIVQFLEQRKDHKRMISSTRRKNMMLLAVIIGGIIVGSWKVPDSIEIIAYTYIAFIESLLKNKGSSLKEPSYLCKIILPRMQQINYGTPTTIRFLWTSEDEMAYQFSKFKPNRKVMGHLKRRMYDNGCRFGSKQYF